MRLRDFEFILHYPWAFQAFPTEETDYLFSPQFKQDLMQVRGSNELTVKLLCQALDNIALAPVWNTDRPETVFFPGNDGKVFVNVRFHGMTNFVGAFNLDMTSEGELYAALLQAVARNHASTYFKAAQAAFRTQTRSIKLYEQMSAKGSILYEETFEQKRRELRLPPGTLTREQVLPLYEAAAQARERYESQRSQAIQQRLARVHNRTLSPELPAGYYSLLAHVALRWIRPLVAEHCPAVAT